MEELNNILTEQLRGLFIKSNLSYNEMYVIINRFGLANHLWHYSHHH